MNVGSQLRHLWTLLEILGIVESVVANVLGCPATEERMFQARVFCGVEIDELLVNSLLLKEVKRQT